MIELAFFEDLQFDRDTLTPNRYKEICARVLAITRCVFHGLMSFRNSPSPFSRFLKYLKYMRNPLIQQVSLCTSYGLASIPSIFARLLMEQGSLPKSPFTSSKPQFLYLPLEKVHMAWSIGLSFLFFIYFYFFGVSILIGL